MKTLPTKTTSPPSPLDETRRGMELLQAGNPVIEVRAIMPDDRWWSGVFDDHAAILKAVDFANDVEAPAVYWTFNRIRGREVTNRIQPAKKGGCIANAHIERIRHVFLDIDNKGDRQAVIELRDELQDYLAVKGWDPPIRMNSGRGSYLFYEVDLPGDTKMVRKIVNNLADRFDRVGAIIDRKCCNAARVSRVPGTFNRKDDCACSQRSYDEPQQPRRHRE